MLYAIMGFMLGYGLGKVAFAYQIEKCEPGALKKIADERKKNERREVDGGEV